MTSTWRERLQNLPEWKLTLSLWGGVGLVACFLSLPLLLFTSHPANEVAIAVALPLVLFIQLPNMLWRWRGLFKLPSSQESKPTITFGTPKWTPHTGSATPESAPALRWSPVVKFLVSVLLRAMALLLAISLVVAAFIDTLIGLDWAVSFSLGAALFFGWAAFGVKNSWFQWRTIDIPAKEPVKDAVGLAERIFGAASPAQS